MKVTTKICLMSLLLMSVCALQAAPRTYNSERHDFIYLTVNLGCQSLIDTTHIDNRYLNKYMGGGTEIGLGYRYYKDKFIFQTGLSARFGSFTMKLPDVNAGNNYSIINRRDVLHSGEVTLPFLVGAEGHRVYFLAGPKVGFRFYGSAIPQAELTPNAPVTLTPAKQPFLYDWNFQGAAEFGVRLGQVYKEKGADVPYSMTRYYLAVFADAGIIRKNTFYPPCNLIESEPGATSAVLNPAINTREYIERMYANFSVGLKFTVLFEIASDGKCLICKDRKREVFEW